MPFPFSEGAFGPFQHPGGEAVGQDIRAYRNIYFVDNIRGSDNNPGLSINTPFATVQKALNTVVDEDTGKRTENTLLTDVPELTAGIIPALFQTLQTKENQEGIRILNICRLDRVEQPPESGPNCCRMSLPL